MQPIDINPYDFQERIKSYAQDIFILWDTTIERYRIYQAYEPIQGFVVDMSVGEARRNKLRLLFTIQGPNGDYRDPNEDDLQKIIDTVQNTITLNVKGFDFITDQMEAEDIRREQEVAPGVKDAMDWGAKEMFKIRTQKGILGFTR